MNTALSLAFIRLLHFIQKFIIIACVFILTSCTDHDAPVHILYDFESDTDLDRIIWKCHTLFSLSQDHATHGNNSLKMEFYPWPYPGLTPILEKTDWHDYKTLCFDIYNPEQDNIQINIRIDDQKNAPDYNDRYNKSLILKPGMNQIRIPLNTLLTSKTGRILNLENICKLIIFMHRPKYKTILYIDYLRLEV